MWHTLAMSIEATGKCTLRSSIHISAVVSVKDLKKETSMNVWKMPGVVSDENVMVLYTISCS